jgi:hypothetical protein
MTKCKSEPLSHGFRCRHILIPVLPAMRVVHYREDQGVVLLSSVAILHPNDR